MCINKQQLVAIFKSDNLKEWLYKSGIIFWRINKQQIVAIFNWIFLIG